MESTIIIAVLMVGLMAFTIFSQRKQQKKAKEREEQIRSGLTVGVKVHTAGGFIGTVAAIDGDRIVIECGPDNVRLELLTRMVAPLSMLEGEGINVEDEEVSTEEETATIAETDAEEDSLTKEPTTEEEAEDKIDALPEE